MNIPLANLLFAPENWLLISVFALLVFGKRLPEVGRSLGKGIIEFKKGLAGIEEGVAPASQKRSIECDDRVALPPPAAAYKFDPYTGKPMQELDAVDQGD